MSRTDTVSPIPRINTTVGGLARAIIDSRDLSAVGPLIDELTGTARYAEATEVRHAFAAVVREAAQMNGYPCGPSSVSLSWDTFSRKVERVLWWDMYEWDGAVAAVGRELAKGGRSGVDFETDEDVAARGGAFVEVGGYDTDTPGYATPGDMRATLTADVSNLTLEELRELRTMIDQQFGGRGVVTYAYDPLTGTTDDGDDGDDPAPDDATDLHTETPPDATR